ncbi:hypothetical protein E2C01_035705 [Portunus trituberculatus]|uniref:Uncharacterized protein n=1 Tax=Portunus trituberculatus TaxID=210409 RepID=A0A5B7F4Z9_PORTR|nr:hypothetical protein [Portunus trituberculatus]
MVTKPLKLRRACPSSFVTSFVPRPATPQPRSPTNGIIYLRVSGQQWRLMTTLTTAPPVYCRHSVRPRR